MMALTLSVAASAAHAREHKHATAPILAAKTAIQSVLLESAAGWNSGDLDRFMTAYEPGPATTYVSGGKVASGYQAIRASYAPRFASGAGSRGTLSMSLVDFRLLGIDNAYVIGRFRLDGIGPNGVIEGLTTLLFHKTPSGWRIAADHS